MKIEDLIQLLTNRLREFKLSRDYAVMNGDLERVVTADKEILALEDTLFKLNLLVDASKSAEVKEATLTEVVTDGSVSVLAEYDITPYATDPLHEEKVMAILSNMGPMDTAEQIDAYIKRKYPSSPVTGEMILTAAKAYSVDTRLMMAIMEQDSRFGTVGLAVSTTNPGNVGNDDSGNTRTYDSWQEGVTAVAEWLHRHRVSGTAPIAPLPDLEPPEYTASSTSPSATSTVATSTAPYPEITFPQATTTPAIATTTPAYPTVTLPTATTTPVVPETVSTTTPTVSTPLEPIEELEPELFIDPVPAVSATEVASSTAQ